MKHVRMEPTPKAQSRYIYTARRWGGACRVRCRALLGVAGLYCLCCPISSSTLESRPLLVLLVFLLPHSCPSCPSPGISCLSCHSDPSDPSGLSRLLSCRSCRSGLSDRSGLSCHSVFLILLVFLVFLAAVSFLYLLLIFLILIRKSHLEIASPPPDYDCAGESTRSRGPVGHMRQSHKGVSCPARADGAHIQGPVCCVSRTWRTSSKNRRADPHRCVSSTLCF
jgi:hypothetical protein